MTLGEVFRRIDQMGITQGKGNMLQYTEGRVESACAYGALHYGKDLGWYEDVQCSRLLSELRGFTKERFSMGIMEANDNGLLTFEELRQLP